MRLLPAIALCASLVHASCLFMPHVAGAGYTSCQTSSQCDPGRNCEQGLCMPPAWWSESYAARYGLLVANDSDQVVPAGALVELVVGPEGAVSVEETGYGPVVVYRDPADGQQSPALALRDPRGSSYAFVVRLPSELPARARRGDLWLYAGGDASQTPSYSAAQQVFSYYQPFDTTALDPASFRVEGTADLNGDLLLRPGAWLVAQEPFAAHEVSVGLQLVGANCGSFGIGLATSHIPQSLAPASFFFTATASGTVRHEAQVTPQDVLTAVGSPFFADGVPRRWSLRATATRVTFLVDGLTTAEVPLPKPPGAPLYLHLYTDDCTMRVSDLRAAPTADQVPTVTLGERVSWYP